MKNAALAANMRRLRAGRSIATLRAQMAEKGLAIGAGTLQKAINGEAGNRLESLDKIAQFFDTTVDQLLQFEGVDETFWPFSAELQQEVLRLKEDEVDRLENVMRLHLRMPIKPEVSAGEVHLTQVTSRSSGVTETVESSQQRPRSDEDAQATNRYSSARRGSAPGKHAALEEAGRYAEDGNGSTQDQRAPRGEGGGRH